MPKELLNEFVDKNCTITLMGNKNKEFKGVVIGIEGYWIKIKDDECTRVINGAMIQDIKTNK